MERQKQNMGNFFSSLELKLVSYGCFLGFGGLSHVFPSYFMMTSSMIYGDQILNFGMRESRLYLHTEAVKSQGFGCPALSFCAVLQDGWPISCTHGTLGFSCCFCATG